jgi:hypothetical protein
VRNSNTAGLIHKKKIWTTALYGTDNWLFINLATLSFTSM